MALLQREAPRVLDLFSGIGGFSLGLERAGMRTVAFCECEDYPRRVLAKHWPEVPIYDDVRTLTADALRRDGIAVDVICGGFPCQDISKAGRGAGLHGERSGLWMEFARLIREVRPKYAIVENSSALLDGPMGDILSTVAAIGYNAEWHSIPAACVGAPHERDRCWIIVSDADVQHGETGLGIFHYLKAAIPAAYHENRNSLWLEAPLPSCRVANGAAEWVDRRKRTECCGNSRPKLSDGGY